ncbi:MAG: GerMN domain-containing protein, partial [Actinomycetota bacterium]|nr:GerMN domain-containing protein [Actinomycetota bacterium]
SSTSSPSAPQTVESTETVYYVGQGKYLYSEPHAMTVFDGKRAEAAVTEFLSFGSLDPDYARGWPDGLRLDSITTEGDSTTISLRGRIDLTDANGLDRRAAEVAIQAMIRTAQVETGAVSFVYNGEPVTTLLGVDVSDPVTREPDQGVDFTPLRAPLSIDSLVEGWSVSSPVTVTVSGNVFEGNVNWELAREGRVLDDGFVTTAFTEWRQAKVRLGALEPGTYTFTAIEISMEDGSRMNVDDKTFTVS